MFDLNAYYTHIVYQRVRNARTRRATAVAVAAVAARVSSLCSRIDDEKRDVVGMQIIQTVSHTGAELASLLAHTNRVSVIG